MISALVSRTCIFGLLLIGLGGCMHVPVSTIYKLATFDILNADPAIIRAAVRYPTALAVRPGGVVMTFKTSGRGGAAETVVTFVLEETKDRADLDAIARYRRDGTTVAAYRLSRDDAVRVRQLLTEHRELAKRGGQAGSKSINVAATACHIKGLPTGAILTSTYLKLDAGGYLPVIEDLDLRTQLSADTLAAQVGPCPEN